ncbi:3D domain-containing protein [Desulfosporosinus shakirovi]|uniref:3D domain-containing protein n=1 Tax=Desulfosporosinus shakirovi TaxID=2885154 RepID=UPI001E4E5335|nr:3D domain-containing protein [Desulfosporosinus sp. SRJS8]MCB8816788.1 G5 domain-containing protein [Desulfosporosinus sp. SRJS8]
MYSLPITTYSDYWRKTKLWSAYFGSLAVLVAGTRYSSLNDPNVGRTIKPSLQLVYFSSIDSLRKDELIEGVPVRKVSNEGLTVQGLTNEGQISRGFGSSNQNYQEALSIEAETRATSKIEIIDKELPFDTQYVESDKLPPGKSQIQVKGEKGTRREVVKTFKVGGQPVDQQVQSFFELKAPKKEVIIRNTQPIPKKKVLIQNSSPGSAKVDVDLTKLNISKTLSVEATAYTYTGNNTATGVKPREGLIAVDPKVIAMGSQVYVEGYGYAIAADTGGSIRGNRIDVFFSTFRQCIDWGRKPVKIHILSST